MIYHVHRAVEGEDRYSYNHLDDLAPTVRDAVDALRPHRSEFDSIIVTGLSGVIVGTPVAMRLRKPLVVFRKAGEDAHSSTPVNHKRLGTRALFLDDFISDGGTYRRVEDALVKTDRGATIVAKYLYRDNDYVEVYS